MPYKNIRKKLKRINNMRVLVFNKDNNLRKQHFDLIYEGLSATGKTFNPKELRSLNGIFEEFELRGVKGEDNLYTLDEGAEDFVIRLDDEDFTIIVTSLENVRWNGLGGRKAGVTLSWLDKSPTDKEYTKNQMKVVSDAVNSTTEA